MSALDVRPDHLDHPVSLGGLSFRFHVVSPRLWPYQSVPPSPVAQG
jgi:hypothetical protein